MRPIPSTLWPGCSPILALTRPIGFGRWRFHTVPPTAEQIARVAMLEACARARKPRRAIVLVEAGKSVADAPERLVRGSRRRVAVG
jgi:hypothetical protein